ncbi:Maf family protein [Paraglaciecola sp.]|uniref:Maf family protein n=1 Tax=Paraglaciecola sp. TaxID=1920173 RepID=UPI003EF6BE3C
MLILASQSPRRAELLSQIGVKFQQSSANIDETPYANENSLDYVLRMAQQKSQEGSDNTSSDNWVLGADTVVVANNEILGKPADQQDSCRMLNMLSDSTHRVLTAVSVTKGKQQNSVLVETLVTFAPLSKDEINWYWQTGEPQDKAGSYGIQGLGGQFVKQIQGSYSAVVGLPLYETKKLLIETGVINEC